jgi:hypothetical protein
MLGANLSTRKKKNNNNNQHSYRLFVFQISVTVKSPVSNVQTTDLVATFQTWIKPAISAVAT